MRAWGPKAAQYIYKRDGGMCIYCGSPACCIDHVIPVKDGGPSSRSNGVACCKKCNVSKGFKTEIDTMTRAIFWLMQQGEDVSWMDDFYK